MAVVEFTCATCGDACVRKVAPRSTPPKYCSNECAHAGRRASPRKTKRDMRCQGCGVAGASPREKTNPRDYSVTRRVLCAQCAQKGSWPPALVAISNPVTTWL